MDDDDALDHIGLSGGTLIEVELRMLFCCISCRARLDDPPTTGDPVVLDRRPPDRFVLFGAPRTRPWTRMCRACWLDRSGAAAVDTNGDGGGDAGGRRDVCSQFAASAQRALRCPACCDANTRTLAHVEIRRGMLVILCACTACCITWPV